MAAVDTNILELPPETMAILEEIVPKRTIMESLKGFVPKSFCDKVTGWFGGERNLFICLGTTAAVIGTIKLSTHIIKRNRRKNWNAVGRNVVVLHTFQRGINVPNLSPFALKLETYLKLANIKYEVDFSEPMGPKGKVPWITLNGESIPDSQFIIERLGREFGKDLSSHLSAEQKSVARAMRIMVEDHLFWSIEVWLAKQASASKLSELVNFSTVTKIIFTLLWPLQRRKLKKLVHAVGMGRHTDEEVAQLVDQDFAALSAWLGNKKFFMGDQPCEVDCAIFGLLAQFKWCNQIYPSLNTDYSNLVDYCERMKQTVWPDWDKYLNPPRA